MKRSLIVVVCLLVAASALAQMPKPAPELKELQPFVGTWGCTGKLYDSPEFGPGHELRSTSEARWILGGFWISVDFKETKTKVAPEPFHGMIFLGYDGEIKKFVLGSIDNTGGGETATSGGWEGDMMTFEGPLHTGQATLTVRDTFTKKGKTQLDHSFSVKEKDGSWRKIEEDFCKK